MRQEKRKVSQKETDLGEIITWITTIGSFFTEYNSGVGFKLLFEIFVKGV